MKHVETINDNPISTLNVTLSQPAHFVVIFLDFDFPIHFQSEEYNIYANLLVIVSL